VGRAIPVRCLQLIPHIAIRREPQALFRDRRAADVAAQPLQLVAFIGPRRHPGMQAESGHLACRITERLIAGGQGLQGEHLAACLLSHGDAVGDGVAQQLIQWDLVHRIQSQVAVLDVSLQQSLPFQKAADAQREEVGQPGELGARRRFDSAKPARAVGALDILPVEEQHVQVDVEIQSAAEALDQCDGAGL